MAESPPVGGASQPASQQQPDSTEKKTTNTTKEERQSRPEVVTQITGKVIVIKINLFIFDISIFHFSIKRLPELWSRIAFSLRIEKYTKL